MALVGRLPFAGVHRLYERYRALNEVGPPWSDLLVKAASSDDLSRLGAQGEIEDWLAIADEARAALREELEAAAQRSEDVSYNLAVILDTLWMK